MTFQERALFYAAPRVTDVTQILRDVPVNTPTPLRSPVGGQKSIAMKLQLLSKPGAAHSGWVFHSFLQKLTSLYGRRSSPRTYLGILEEGRVAAFRQFSLVGPGELALLLAVGEHPAACLGVLVEAERSFAPSLFDTDGYYCGSASTRQLPGARAQVVRTGHRRGRHDAAFLPPTSGRVQCTATANDPIAPHYPHGLTARPQLRLQDT